MKTRKDLRGCTIYIARVNKSGYTTMSRPCEDCMSAILHSGIKEFVYTNEVGGYSIEQTRWTRQLLH
jgi:deoxycytidylate deaminase